MQLSSEKHIAGSTLISAIGVILIDRQDLLTIVIDAARTAHVGRQHAAFRALQRFGELGGRSEEAIEVLDAILSGESHYINITLVGARLALTDRSEHPALLQRFYASEREHIRAGVISYIDRVRTMHGHRDCPVSAGIILRAAHMEQGLLQELALSDSESLTPEELSGNDAMLHWMLDSDDPKVRSLAERLLERVNRPTADER